MIMKHFIKTLVGAGAAMLVFSQILPVLAVSYSSDNYSIVDPAFGVGSETTGSSTTWRLIGSIGESAIGYFTSSTGASFLGRSGSLTYPRCTSPTLSGTPANGQAQLSWTAATCSGGWTLTSYEVCSGSTTNTYSSCSDVGNILASNRTATPSVAVWYRIRVIATGAASNGSPAGNVASRSNELQVTASGGAGGGGGGGGGGEITSLSVTAPNGGEKIVAATSKTITWTSSGTAGISTIRLKLSTDGGFTFPTILASGESNDGTYVWTVPALSGAQYRVMIEGLNTQGTVIISDMSNDNFSIGPVGAIPEPIVTTTPPPATPTSARVSPSPVSNVSVRMSGGAFPNATVTILRDGTQVGTTTSDNTGVWLFTMSNLTPGALYTFAFNAVDSTGQRSVTTTRTVTLPTNNPLFELVNLLVAPTIVASKTSVQPGEQVKFSGTAVPGTSLNLEFNDLTKTLAVGANGLWEMFRGTQGLSGAFSARGQLSFGLETSSWSAPIAFTVGGAAVSPTLFRAADISGDGRVNLTDFSRLVAHWSKSVPPAPTNVDLYIDNQVSLKDLSVLLNKWTG